MKKADLLVKQLHLNVGNVTKENIMKKKSTNPRMAMMMGRAMRRPALDVTPTVARPAVNPMAAMASAPTMPGMKKGGMSCATKTDAKMIAKKEVKGHEKSMHGMKKGGITEKGTGEKYASKAAMMRHEKKETKAEEMKEHGMCGGGKAKKYAAGGRMISKGEHPVQKQSKRGAIAVKMARGGVAKTVTKEMEYDYKTGKKSFAGSTAKRDAHAEKEGKIVAKHLEYDKSKKMARGGGCEIRGKTKGRII